MELYLNKRGRFDHAPLSQTVFRGIFHEIRDQDYRFFLGLNGVLKCIFVQGGDSIFEEGYLFKRTPGGYWLYYDGSLYSEAKALIDRYYVPVALENLSPEGHQREKKVLNKALKRWDYITKNPELADLKDIMDTRALKWESLKFRQCIKGTVPVLPPETIFIDYDCIPLIVSEGCGANCKFCFVKTGSQPRVRSFKEIDASIKGLRAHLRDDVQNYAGLFLGQNDALLCDIDHLIHASYKAWEAFDFETNPFKEKRLFLFGSPVSLLKQGTHRLLKLDRLPFSWIHLNIGIESYHPKTLETLGRPFDQEMLKDVMQMINEIHLNTKRLEIGMNFLLFKKNPQGHLASIEEFVGGLNVPGRGFVFISPFLGDFIKMGQIKREIFKLKARNSHRIFLYILVPFV